MLESMSKIETSISPAWVLNFKAWNCKNCQEEGVRRSKPHCVTGRNHHLVPGWLSIRLLILTHLVPVSQQALGLLCWIEAHQACTRITSFTRLPQSEEASCGGPTECHSTGHLSWHDDLQLASVICQV